MKRHSTFDLKERARLALNHLTRNVDPKLNYQPYFYTFLETNPPEGRHDWADFGDLTGRYVDAIILARQIIGEESISEVEEWLRKLLISYFDEDNGLSYRPRTSYSIHEAEMFDQSSVLYGLLTWYKSTQDKEVKQHIDKMIEGLWNIAHKNEDSCYYARPVYPPDFVFPKDSLLRDQYNRDKVYYGGRQIQPLVQYYQETENELAFKLAKNLCNYIVKYDETFKEDGSFLGHFHSRIATIAGVLRCGIVMNNKEFILWAKKIYDWAKKQGSSFGWFPELILEKGKYETCETCCIIDMIDVAIMLAESGYKEYWNDVERFVRNHLIESQLVDIGWVNQIIFRDDNGISTFYKVAERVRGGFAGWSKPNDWRGWKEYSMMNCCSPAGARGLFLAWDHIIRDSEEGIHIDLLLSREDALLKLISYLPYEGRIDIIPYKEGSVFLRIPDWVKREEIEINSGGSQLIPDYQGDYLFFPYVQRKNILTIIFPVKEDFKREEIGGKMYSLTWKGDTVMDIAPKGERYPLYQRDTAYYANKENEI